MIGRISRARRGTISLVALCFVAVMGISLAGYIAVCSRSMNLSNRSFQSKLGQQLAELGVDEALRAFNKNNWDDWVSAGLTADWTISGTTATCTLTFPAGKFGQGVTGSVKIRVDNYNANQLDSTWNTATNYQTGDLVGLNGIWYRCVVAHSNRSPNNVATSASTSIFWVEEQMPLAIPWNSATSYRTEAVVYYRGGWYRCTSAHVNQPPPYNSSNSYWTFIPVITTSVPTATSNNQSMLNYWNGSTWTWWQYNGGWDNQPAFAWRWRGNPNSYAVDDVVNYNGRWYRCRIAFTNSNTPPPSSPFYWSSTPDNAMWAWNATSLKYNLDDVVYYGSTGQWYRCIRAHTSSGSVNPSNPIYWSNAPRRNQAWNTDRQYSQNDTVHYNGVWYLSLQNSNIGQNPSTATIYWVGANTATASYQWNASTAYAVGNYRCYGGVWYRCSTANTGQSPNNSSFWSASWAQSSGNTTGAPVVYAESTINITGSPPIKTQLRATIARASLFPNAVAANTTISANSGGLVDSYDSTQGTYASQVNTATNFSAVVAAGSNSGTAITLSSTTVRGYISAPSNSTTPFAPLFSSGGSVKGFTSPASPNIDLSQISRSPYIPQFETLPLGGLTGAFTAGNFPKGTALVPSSTVNIGTPGATTPSRYFYDGNLTIGTGSFPTLRINGPVILYVNGDLFVTASGSTGRIDINNTGSAEIHVAGRFMADAGGQGILSYNNDPKNLIIICDTTSSGSHFYSEGINPLYGVLYVPNTTSSTGVFNNNNGTNIYGAISANKVTFSGADMNIHYDTSLRHAAFAGVDQPHTVVDWRELPATEQATMP